MNESEMILLKFYKEIYNRVLTRGYRVWYSVSREGRWLLMDNNLYYTCKDILKLLKTLLKDYTLWELEIKDDTIILKKKEPERYL